MLPDTTPYTHTHTHTHTHTYGFSSPPLSLFTVPQGLLTHRCCSGGEPTLLAAFPQSSSEVLPWRACLVSKLNTHFLPSLSRSQPISLSKLSPHVPAKHNTTCQSSNPSLTSLNLRLSTRSFFFLAFCPPTLTATARQGLGGRQHPLCWVLCNHRTCLLL